MTLFDSPAFEGHEAVHAFHDAASGLKCIIAVHSTARGPSAGGCRMWAYPSSEAALVDALRLSRAMSYKNAVADLELGGGKAVIIGDSKTQKTPALFEAFGRAVDQVCGRYWAAEDVGVSPGDLAHARTQTRYVAGLDGHPAASGDPSPVTAEGVFRGIGLCVRRAYGSDLSGVTVAIQGVGHVGGQGQGFLQFRYIDAAALQHRAPLEVEFVHGHGGDPFRHAAAPPGQEGSPHPPTPRRKPQVQGGRLHLSLDQWRLGGDGAGRGQDLDGLAGQYPGKPCPRGAQRRPSAAGA